MLLNILAKQSVHQKNHSYIIRHKNPTKMVITCGLDNLHHVHKHEPAMMQVIVEPSGLLM